jgi:hypothetical protein
MHLGSRSSSYLPRMRIRNVKLDSRKTTFLVCFILFLIGFALYEWAAKSPLLFMLNEKEVAFYKSRFSNAVVTGNCRISALSETIGFPPNSDIYLCAELQMSYIPQRTKLVLTHLKLVTKTETYTSYKTFGTIEIGRQELRQFLQQEMRSDVFDSYFLKRNTPAVDEIPKIKDVIKSAFERDLDGSHVISISITPATSGSVDDVAVDKLYVARIKYVRNGQEKEISAYYGNTKNYWLMPKKDDLEKLDH